MGRVKEKNLIKPTSQFCLDFFLKIIKICVSFMQMGGVSGSVIL